MWKLQALKMCAAISPSIGIFLGHAESIIIILVGERNVVNMQYEMKALSSKDNSSGFQVWLLQFHKLMLPPDILEDWTSLNKLESLAGNSSFLILYSAGKELSKNEDGESLASEPMPNVVRCWVKPTFSHVPFLKRRTSQIVVWIAKIRSATVPDRDLDPAKFNAYKYY